MGSTPGASGCQTTVCSCWTDDFAPWSIQSRKVEISVAVRLRAPDLFSGGGISMSLRCFAAAMTRLSSAWPGVTAGPDSPPLSMSSGDSMLRRALVVVLLWQEMQLDFRKG